MTRHSMDRVNGVASSPGDTSPSPAAVASQGWLVAAPDTDHPTMAEATPPPTQRSPWLWRSVVVVAVIGVVLSVVNAYHAFVNSEASTFMVSLLAVVLFIAAPPYLPVQYWPSWLSGRRRR